MGCINHNGAISLVNVKALKTIHTWI